MNNLELLVTSWKCARYVRDASNITGSEQEAARSRLEMRRDLVNAMVVRLQQLTPAQLDELQQKADQRAQAEAAARGRTPPAGGNAAAVAPGSTGQLSPCGVPSGARLLPMKLAPPNSTSTCKAPPVYVVAVTTRCCARKPPTPSAKLRASKVSTSARSSVPTPASTGAPCSKPVPACPCSPSGACWNFACPRASRVTRALQR